MQCNVDTGGCFSFAMAVQYDEGNEWLVASDDEYLGQSMYLSGTKGLYWLGRYK